MTPNDIVVSRYPRRLTVSDVRALLSLRDNKTRDILTDLILHRLRDRYITPLENVPLEFKSGFLTMAACCLMIETFQCFKVGKKDTKRPGEGKRAFKDFFSDHRVEFPGIDGEEFYVKVRCGILHQAQTHGRFRIVREGQLFDSTSKRINATIFLKALKRVVEDYCNNLRRQEMDRESWTSALRKIEFICETIENG
jgi:hypothetical protein